MTLDPSRNTRMMLALSAIVTVLVPTLALGQTLPGGADIVPDIMVRGRGWSQATNLREMGEFLLGLVEVSLMTAALVFHPATWSARRSRIYFHLMHQNFLFSLVGMIVGFLVIHHGYLIGFVIFGLGGLLRFRIDMDEPADTTRLIIVSLIGLCIGLDLPVMALITTISAWVVIYLFGERARCFLSVRFEEKKFGPADIETLSEFLKTRGFEPIAVSKSRFKPAADYMLRSDTCNRQVIDKVMGEYRATKHSTVKDWHLE